MLCSPNSETETQQLKETLAMFLILPTSSHMNLYFSLIGFVNCDPQAKLLLNNLEGRLSRMFNKKRDLKQTNSLVQIEQNSQGWKVLSLQHAFDFSF